MKRHTMLWFACAVWWPVDTHAQDVQSMVASAPDGDVRISFAARPDVCRDGWQSGRGSDDHWEPADSCVDGPIRVQLRKDGDAILGVRVYVGGRWRASSPRVSDLGTVSAPAAASYLMQLVRSEPVAHRAIHPAAMADSTEIWPELIRFARDTTLSKRTNKEAMNWLGITAGRLFEDDEVRDDESEPRRRALFAVTQLPADQGVPRLIEISESHRFQYLRGLALFWLGQSGDPRALPVMERAFRARS